MAAAPVLLLPLLLLMAYSADAQLTAGYYKNSCPRLFSTVKSVVKAAIAKERRMGASLLRLHFHDCFVQGCDGSILLDDTPGSLGEKTAAPNNNSVRGFDMVDVIKSRVESVCPRVVSCADILAIAARDSVAILGGPKWKVKLGRRDSRTANRTAANSGIPPPSSTLNNLINRFSALRLSAKDMVVLSGAHTIGQARCKVFRSHIYNESNVDASFAVSRRRICPLTGGVGDDNLAPLDIQSPTDFDNAYYENLLSDRGLLHSDQILVGGQTDSLVRYYAGSPPAFRDDFSAAMIRMGDISPLTGSRGEIRNNCRRVN